jgi:hypothetical protein
VSLAREGRTPDEGDKSRVAERLAIAIAASTTASTAMGVAKAAAIAEIAGAGAKVASGALLSSMGAKITAVALLGAVGTAVVVGQMGSKQSAPSSVNVPAVEIKRAAPASPVSAAPVAAEEQATAEPAVEPKAPVKSSAAAVQSSKPSLAEEAALLHQAQSAWRAGQSAEALRLANEHAQRFPHSQLANERDVLRVLSLCKLGQNQAAKQVGARLLLKAQDSPWYESVAQSCAAK